MHTGHFAESGRFFYDLIELSKMRVPTVCVVFGSSTAGGAYQPGLSDYNIVVKNQSKIFLAGPPLVKMATGEESDDETLGGAADARGGLGPRRLLRRGRDGRHPHVPRGRLAPQLAQARPGARRSRATSRVYDPEELLGIVSRDLRQPVDVRDVIARVVDGSRFEEFKARYGTTMVCGWASIHGYPVGILGNNGVIYPARRGEGRPVHPAVQPDRRAAGLPAEHHRLHGRHGRRGRGHHQEGLARCSTR